MKIEIKVTNFKLTSAIERYAIEKINSLDRFIDENLLKQGEDSVVAYIELAMTTRHHHKGDIFRAEVDVRLPRKVVRAEAESSDIMAAIDEVKDELALELKKYKEKKESIFKKGSRILKNIFISEEQ